MLLNLHVSYGTHTSLLLHASDLTSNTCLVMFLLKSLVCFAGETFVPKNVDKKKKKKLQQLERKMLGWGMCSS